MEKEDWLNYGLGDSVQTVRFHATSLASYFECFWLLFRPKESIVMSGISDFAGGRMNRLIMVIPRQRDRLNLISWKSQSFGTWRINKKIVKIERRAKKEQK